MNYLLQKYILNELTEEENEELQECIENGTITQEEFEQAEEIKQANESKRLKNIFDKSFEKAQEIRQSEKHKFLKALLAFILISSFLALLISIGIQEKEVIVQYNALIV